MTLDSTAGQPIVTWRIPGWHCRVGIVSCCFMVGLVLAAPLTAIAIDVQHEHKTAGFFDDDRRNDEE